MSITEKHYTADGRHPEDVIFHEKQYIDRLQRHIDEVFNKLTADLNLNEKGTNWLFDYIYNESHDIDFEEFLAKTGVTYDTLVN